LIKTKFTGVFYNETINNGKVFYIRYKSNGKPIREKVGSEKEGVNAAYANKIRAKRTSIDRLKEDAPMLLNQKLPTFDECFNMYYKSIENKSDSQNTKRRYEIHVKSTFGHIKMDDITTQMVEDFKSKARKLKSLKTSREYAPKTINDWINIVGTVFNYMISKKDLNVKNPADAAKIEREKVNNDRERYLELDEIKKVWNALDNRQEFFDTQIRNEVTENLKIFLALSLSTGARLRSVLTISKADVNLNTNTIIIINHKTNNTYHGYIHPKYRELIEKRMENLSPIDYLVNSSSTELNRVSINKVLQPIFNKLFNQGLKLEDSKRRVVIHTLRHTFASQLAIAETPIYTIMRLMDHADISQTIRYAKLSSDSGKDAVQKLKF
jgi:integrase